MFSHFFKFKKISLYKQFMKDIVENSNIENKDFFLEQIDKISQMTFVLQEIIFRYREVEKISQAPCHCKQTHESGVGDVVPLVGFHMETDSGKNTGYILLCAGHISTLLLEHPLVLRKENNIKIIKSITSSYLLNTPWENYFTPVNAMSSNDKCQYEVGKLKDDFFTEWKHFYFTKFPQDYLTLVSNGDYAVVNSIWEVYGLAHINIISLGKLGIYYVVAQSASMALMLKCEDYSGQYYTAQMDSPDSIESFSGSIHDIIK